MKLWKKIWVLTLCLALVGGLIAPIRTVEAEEAETEPIVITTFYETGEVPTDDNVIAELMKEDLGVILDVEYLVGDLDERVGVMVASGEYPDLMPFEQRIVDAGGCSPAR